MSWCWISAAHCSGLDRAQAQSPSQLLWPKLVVSGLHGRVKAAIDFPRPDGRNGAYTPVNDSRQLVPDTVARWMATAKNRGAWCTDPVPLFEAVGWPGTAAAGPAVQRKNHAWEEP